MKGWYTISMQRSLGRLGEKSEVYPMRVGRSEANTIRAIASATGSKKQHVILNAIRRGLKLPANGNK